MACEQIKKEKKEKVFIQQQQSFNIKWCVNWKAATVGNNNILNRAI